MKIDSAILYGPCPCGSGKKFKFCCLPEVRDGRFAVPSEISPEDCAIPLKTEMRIAVERELSGWALRCMAERSKIVEKFSLRD